MAAKKKIKCSPLTSSATTSAPPPHRHSLQTTPKLESPKETKCFVTLFLGGGVGCFLSFVSTEKGCR